MKDHECDKERELNIIHENVKIIDSKIDLMGDRIEKKIDDLMAWKWRVIGGAFVISVIISLFGKLK